MQVEPNGSLEVREDIVFSFFGPFSGAYRDIPLRQGERVDSVLVSENGRPYRPGGNATIGSYGAPGTFGVDASDKRVRVVWHYSALSERRTFTVTYRFRGLAVAYDDVVDVNLKVWGGHWPVPLTDLRAELELPAPVSLAGERYRVWGHPGWVRGVVERTEEAALLGAQGIPAKQFVELRVVFPRRLLTSTGGAQVLPGNALTRIVRQEEDDFKEIQRDRERIRQWTEDNIGRTLLVLLALGLGPALAIIFAVWLVFGRERNTGYDREYEQAPPTETPPALVPPLLRQGTYPGSLEFTATLFDLIRRGYYTSKAVTTEKKTWAGLRSEQVADLELSLGDTAIDLAEFEGPVTKVFDAVLEDGPERLSNMRDRIEDTRASNSTRFTSFKEDVSDAIAARRWYVGVGARAFAAIIVAFLATAAILLWLGISGFRAEAPRWADIVLIALGACAIVNAILLVVGAANAKLWRRRSRDGQLEAQRWDAFRRYLTDFPRLDEAPPATLELWERFLVYGIAFGIAERVLQGAQLHMPEELHDQSAIYWISPHGDLGSGASALAIGDLSSGFGSALAPPSSSGSGGGFSGGGGGGGGGAW